MKDDNARESLDSKDELAWSPASIENGHATAQSPHLNLPTKQNFLAPLDLPSGASTPNLETTRQGNPIATFPPPAPTWLNMPNKGQLAILVGSRFVDFFQQAALQTFMVHQLKSFDPALDEDVIAHQAGVLQGAFTASQIVSAIVWGRIADQPQVGRKLVLQIGLIGTSLGCIGVAFSQSYGEAVFWRFMSGAINGTVGSARTMVAEATPKAWHPRAFLLLPAAFNIANVFGPILAGMLSEPFLRYRFLFGPGGTFGGDSGVLWLEKYPFALSNLMSTVLLAVEALIVHFALQETLKSKVPFRPVVLLKKLLARISNAKAHGYRIVASREQGAGLLDNQERTSFEMERLTSRGEKLTAEDRRPQPSSSSAPNPASGLWVLLTVAIFDFHMGAFNNLWMLFLATRRSLLPGTQPIVTAPVTPPADIPVPPSLMSRDLSPRGLFYFASGLAFPPQTIGFALAIIGFIGVALQFLLYPWANSRFGLMRSFQGSLFLFPIAYFLAPYIALLPSSSSAPNPASGLWVWLGISVVLFFQVAARTFALPGTIILINNSSPHPSVLGTIHGVGQATSATFRTLGPMLAGYWYGVWTKRGVVGMAWWIVALIACVGCVASFWVRNGSGHEVFLPGEDDVRKDTQTSGGSGDGR